MKKIKLTGVNEDVIYDIMPNGLEVYLVPNNKVRNFYMTFNTRFGSLYTEFKKNGEDKYTKIPNGVAHFLEHLTFKMADGDASTHFADLGSSSNAYTSFKVTCYEVYGFDLFKENLEYLLDYVQTPYYSKELVENEKGIITEEIKMYEDNPAVAVSHEMHQMLFHHDHRKYLVSGTIADVKKTTLKDIENAYQTFYHPSNMFIIITGNFNAEEALAIIHENQAHKTFGPKPHIHLKTILEPAKVVKENLTIPTNIEIPKVNVGLKIPLSSFKNIKLSLPELNVYIEVILNAIFGRTSALKERLSQGNIITDIFYFYKFMTDDYLIINIIAETLYPNRFIALVKETLNDLQFTEEDLVLKKRVAISNYILSFDDIDEVNTALQTDLINYGQISTDLYDIYTNFDYEIALKVMKKITTREMAVLILEPQDQ